MRHGPIELILLPLLSVAACGGPPAEFGAERRLPAEKRPTMWEATTKQRLGVSDMSAPETPTRFVGDTPEGWVEQEPQPKRFRDLIWTISGATGAECWLTGSVGGGVAGNMARWYRQFEQEPASAESLPEVAFAGGTGRLLELSGSYNGEPGRAMMLAFDSRGSTVTSLKLVGPEDVVKQNRDKFLALAASLRRQGGSGERGGGAAGGGAAGGDPHGGGLAAEPFTATVPSSWVAKTGTSRALHHTFGAGGEVYVSQLNGPLRSMLDIWRTEVGLREPLTDEEFQAVPRCEMLGPDALWLDTTGDYHGVTGNAIPNARLLVAVRSDGNSITFAKLIGPAADVMAEVEAFRAFCASIRRKS